VGTYSVSLSIFDLFLVVLFSFVGYVMNILRFPAAPLSLGYVLGPMLEENLRRSLSLSRGSWMVFLERPLSASFLAVALFLIVWSVWKRPATSKT